MIINANALNIPLADKSVHMIVTSPPYWGLRNYQVDGQLGLERTPEEYIANMVAVFRECWRVLRDDGTCWVNIGDSYATNPPGNKGNWSKKQLSNFGSLQHSGTLSIGMKPKDLVGIPWRLAFALQQPYEHSLIKDKVNRAWLSGIIDGEGCITSNEVETSMQNGRAANPSYPIILQVRMSDRQALNRIVEITGVSKVQDEHLSPSQIGTLQRAPSCWKTSGDNAMRILAECYPYLTVKKPQALIAWNLQMLKEGIETKRGISIPKENMEKRKLLFTIIRSLNQRQEVDFPSWLVEPYIETEPGWYLRSDCIWNKPNPMPESVTDRPTKSHEYLFLLAKQERYYYDNEAIREDFTDERMGNPGKYNKTSSEERKANNDRQDLGFINNGGGWERGEILGGRNRRTVWTIPTAPYKGAHFATFPPALVEPCIKAGTSERGVCPKCGKGWKRIMKAEGGTIGHSWSDHKDDITLGNRAENAAKGGHGYRKIELGWQPACTCGQDNGGPLEPIPAIVFDPFVGSGTTVKVAYDLGRRGVGLDLSLEYLSEQATTRIHNGHTGRLL